MSSGIVRNVPVTLVTVSDHDQKGLTAIVALQHKLDVTPTLVRDLVVDEQGRATFDGRVLTVNADSARWVFVSGPNTPAVQPGVQAIRVLDVRSYKPANSDVTHQRIVKDIMMAPIIDKN
jgi:hypothetical protein